METTTTAARGNRREYTFELLAEYSKKMYDILVQRYPMESPIYYIGESDPFCLGQRHFIIKGSEETFKGMVNYPNIIYRQTLLDAISGRPSVPSMIRDIRKEVEPVHVHIGGWTLCQ